MSSVDVDVHPRALSNKMRACTEVAAILNIVGLGEMIVTIVAL